MYSSDTLFPDIDFPETPASDPKLSADRRRTLRQRAAVDAGRHPLTGGRLSDDSEARCGNCRFRDLLRYHDRAYPKCVIDGYDVPHSAASDVRAWWPACPRHEYGGPIAWPDAARSGPA